MEPEGLSQFSQEPATSPYVETDMQPTPKDLLGHYSCWHIDLRCVTLFQEV
jgi:hypothetical protein